MKSRFHPEALFEFDEADDYYSLVSEELGERFRSQVRSTVRKIERSPRSWPIYDEEIRRCLVERFPFLIFFMEIDDYLLIVAVMHTSRKPDYWKHRIN